MTLRVAAGECYGLLGPNGAGKSTTVGMLGTLVRPTSGRARGRRLRRRRPAARGAPPDRLRDAGGRRRCVRDGARAARPAGAPARAPRAPRQRRRAQLLLEIVDLGRCGRQAPGRILGRHAAARRPGGLADAPARRGVPGRADRGPRPARARGDLGRAGPAASASRASRSCSPRTTWRRPIGCATGSGSSTAAASSSRARRPQLKASVGSDSLEDVYLHYTGHVFEPSDGAAS